MVCRISLFLSTVMEAGMVVVSRKMPRNVSEVDGPSALSAFFGGVYFITLVIHLGHVLGAARRTCWPCCK